jgi:MFS superfamily sulfate permease-like transporter
LHAELEIHTILGCYCPYNVMQTREAIPRQVADEVVAEQSIEWAKFAFALAFLVGILQMVAGMLRLGFIVGFISEPVIIGFTTGAAFLIAATQVRILS